MRILDRYLLRQFVPPWLWCLATFVVLTIIVELFGRLDEILRYHVTAAQLLRFYGYFVPTIIVESMPLTLLIATTFTLGHMNRSNETTAMLASGLSIRSIIAPLLCLGMLVSLGMFWINDRVVPLTAQIYEQMKLDLFQPPPEDQVEVPPNTIENIAFFGQQGRIFHILRYAPTERTLWEVTILEHDDLHRVTGKIYAQKMVWQGGGWLLSRGIIDRGQPRPFTELFMQLPERPDDFAAPFNSVERMPVKHLARYITQLQRVSGLPTLRFEVELHRKIAHPLTNLVIMCLGIPFALRRGRGAHILTGIAQALVLGIIYYGVLAITVALGKGGSLPPVLAAWLPHVVFAAIGWSAMQRLG